MHQFIEQFIQLFLEMSPWLLLGLFISGLLKAWLSNAVIQKWLGGKGIGPIFRSAVVGVPLPLCSCSVLPVALSLKRSGASPASTVSFLVSTPETGVDSIAVSYALLGPFMAIVRPVAAIISAITTGIMVMMSNKEKVQIPIQDSEPSSGCSCSQSSCCDTTTDQKSGIKEGLRYAFSSVYDDMKWWLVAGVAVAALFSSLISTEILGSWGQGPLAMIVMALIGIPIYICATASTPIAAALLLAGVSPGAVLVFMLVGPATNIGSIAILKKEMGTRVITTYLSTMITVSIALGLVLDYLVARFQIDIPAQMTDVGVDFPPFIAIASALFLILMIFVPIRRRLIGA